MSIDTIIKSLEKEYGEGTIQCLGDKVGKEIPHIPTGIYSLDKYVLGCGGLPKGRIIEIYAEPACGKSTLLYTMIASAQKHEPQKSCVLIETEFTFDPTWANKNGINVDKLFINQPQCGEEGIDIAEKLIKSGECSIVAIDSVANLIPKAELDGEVSDQQMGLLARLMSKACRRLSLAINSTDTILILVNQTTANINAGPYAPQTTTKAGKSIKFYSTIRLSLGRIGTNKEGDEAVSNRVKIKAEKNKVFKPYRETLLELNFDSGFDKELDLVNVAIDKRIIKQSGAWFQYENEKFQGKTAVKDFLRLDSNLLDLKDKVEAYKSEEDSVLVELFKKAKKADVQTL